MDFISETFGFLVGMSPWWWVALAFGLAALEMATFSFFLLWPALASLLMAILIAINPDMGAGAQLISFSIMTVLLTGLGRYFFTKYGDGAGEGNTALNQRGARFVGRTGKVLEFANGEGVIELEGMRWRAKWPDPQSVGGETVRVVSADGMTLNVEKVD